MRTLLISIASLVLLVALGSYALWTTQRPAGLYLSDLRIKVAVNEGVPAGNGNLLGIQPELYPADYQSLYRLHRKLGAYLQGARDLGLLNAKTVVVLPEHIGTWLWARGEKDELYQAAHEEEAFNWLAVSNPLRFARAWLRASGKDRLQDTQLRMKAEAMASDYQALFGGLAKEFGVTLVAGSIVLPEPIVAGGQLHVGRGALYNASVVFGADGQPLGQPQRQLYPLYETRNYIRASKDQHLQVLDTPAGRLGILIGNDSWYAANYVQLNSQAAQLIAVPASIADKGHWNLPWRGFNRRHIPEDATLKPGEVTEGQAWQRLNLGPASVSVFLRGQFWDQFSDGQGFASHAGIARGSDGGRGARLINLWL
ncbi:nitrilase-related carbon-nitrogen hydrolase [Pseudomonas abieticivorans]|uniref:nitrilase-related carbon-nitrogen hydrolase n=1 Tax=Pseudomonas abieticivorans TaxID=2931382 RepID=UPI0020BE9B42|nr:nitrilase-related carbon-nitrogen hydrolase [Pseudomonas sp. PIA16]